MAMNAAACAQKYSINDCAANVANARRTAVGLRGGSANKDRFLIVLAANEIQNIGLRSTLHMTVAGTDGSKSYDQHNAHRMRSVHRI
jgi:hypothetical protein